MRIALFAAAAVIAASCSDSAGTDTADATATDIRIDAERVFPESVTATADGAVIIGSTQGGVYRAGPGETVASKWIEATEENGLQAVFGVLAHDASDTLWLCSGAGFGGGGGGAPRAVSALRAFDLDSGAYKAGYPFPGGTGLCNDATVGPDGTVYAADTQGARILKLAPGADSLELFGADEALAGVDGIVFAEDGTLYVNNVTTNQILRVDIGDDGMMGALHTLELSQDLGGPDGFRLIDGSRFLMAEGQAGKLDLVEIDGDRAEITVLKDGLDASPGATMARGVAYVIEGKIGFLMDPARQGEDPGDFIAYAVPLD